MLRAALAALLGCIVACSARSPSAPPKPANPADTPPAEAAAPQANRPVILVFGDSLSAGYGLHPGESWPSLLQSKVGDGYRVVNASVSGETTAGGLTRFPQALREHKPVLVVLELGGNDGLRGLSVATAEKNLGSMIELAKSSGAKVLLISMQMPPNLGEAYVAQFKAVFANLAARYHLPDPPFLLSGLEDHPELFQADEIHPVASAEPTLLANVYPSVAKLLRP